MNVIILTDECLFIKTSLIFSEDGPSVKEHLTFGGSLKFALVTLFNNTWALNEFIFLHPVFGVSDPLHHITNLYKAKTQLLQPISTDPSTQ